MRIALVQMELPVLVEIRAAVYAVFWIYPRPVFIAFLVQSRRGCNVMIGMRLTVEVSDKEEEVRGG